MSDKIDIIPEFKIVLDETQLRDLCLFVSIWSQADFMINILISFLTNTEVNVVCTMLDTMTSGPRINLLRRLSSKLENKDLKIEIRAIIDDLNHLIEKRNHIMHGMWCYYFEKSWQDSCPAAIYDKSPDKPLFASEIPDLTIKITKVTRDLGSVLAKLTPAFAVGKAPRQRFQSKDGAPPPDGQPEKWQRVTPR